MSRSVKRLTGKLKVCKTFGAMARVLLLLALACGVLSQGTDWPGVRYIYRTDRQNYAGAKATCAAMGAHLAVANSEAEALHLANLAQKTQTQYEYTFVGFFWNGREWTTETGGTLASSGWMKWIKGEPNNATQNVNGATVYESCGSINWEGRLNDIACEFELPFVCEFKPLPA